MQRIALYTCAGKENVGVEISDDDKFILHRLLFCIEFKKIILLSRV